MPLAVVTGGSRGLGRATVEELTARGWKVLAPSRSELDLQNGNAIRHWCSELGGVPVDALVHAAGINHPQPVSEVSAATWDETFQVNLNAFRQLVQALTPSLRGGRVVAIGSILGVVTRPGRAAYSASKAALIALVRSFAIELASQSTLVNAVCPGFIDTDLTRQNNTPAQLAELSQRIPLARLGTPAEIAKLTAWLCSEKNSYLTGQAVIIDGGFTCL